MMEKITIEIYQEQFNGEFHADIHQGEKSSYFASDELKELMRQVSEYIIN